MTSQQNGDFNEPRYIDTTSYRHHIGTNIKKSSYSKETYKIISANLTSVRYDVKLSSIL